MAAKRLGTKGKQSGSKANGGARLGPGCIGALKRTDTKSGDLVFVSNGNSAKPADSRKRQD
jgi:hypothetical protein